MGQILSLNATVEIGLGTYENCIQTKDWTPLEPEIVEQKFYCKEIGNVALETKVAGETGDIEVIQVDN